MEPPKSTTTLPPFSFGAQLPSASADPSPATSSATVNLSDNVSFVSSPASGIGSGYNSANVHDTGVPRVTFAPPKLPVAENTNEAEDRREYFSAQQLTLYSSATKSSPSPVAAMPVVSKPTVQLTQHKPISVIGPPQSQPSKPDSGMGVVSGTITPKPFSFGFTQIDNSKVTAASEITTNNSILNPPKFNPVVSKPVEKQPGSKKEEPASASFVNSSTLSSKLRDFGDIVQNKYGTENVNPSGTWRGFGVGGAPQPMFGSLTESSSAKEKTQPTSFVAANANKPVTEEHEDDFVPTAEFAPVIPLLPLVETKRGDEDQNVLFKHRGKLLCFVKETKEWEERGLGEIKILQSKVNAKKIRVVMWREKVHKIACNHWVTKEMAITNYQDSPKNLNWTAVDFADAEEGPKTEIFECRFGNKEVAKEFKKQMELAISLVDKTPVTPEKSDLSKASIEKIEEIKPLNLAPLSSLFKNPEGQWNCKACYTDNIKESTACVCCNTTKPGLASDLKSSSGVMPATTAAVAPPKFSFGFNVPAPTTTSTPPTKESTTFTLKSSSVISDCTGGKQLVSTVLGQPDQEVKNEDSALTRRAPSPVLDFSKLSSGMHSYGNLGSTSSNPFGSSSKKGFGTVAIQPVFGSIPIASTTTSESPCAARAEEGEDDFVPTGEFEPVVHLPPLVETKKGDENENVLFQHRVKLLRFVTETREWKEIGVGDIKILQAKDNAEKIRIVMWSLWTEKVYKIACNHWVTKELSITDYLGNRKILSWTAVDFAKVEEGPKPEIFVCRFRQEYKAQEFKREVEKAVDIVKNTGSASSPGSPKQIAKRRRIVPASSS